MKIGIDCDGVLYDFVGAFRQYLLAKYPDDFDPEGLPEPDRWEMWEAWGIEKDRFWQLFREGISAGVVFRVGAPYPGAVEALTELRAAGHKLHIVTHRPVEAIASTSAWLQEHNVPYDTLTFSADKTVVPVDVFIEDNIDNARAVEAVGEKAVLIDRPWNRSATDLRRAPDWDVVPELIDWLGADLVLDPPSDDEFDHSHDRTSESGGKKGVKPERMSLIPHPGLKAIARVYAHGERKYAAHNWRKGYPWSWSLDALERHVGAFKDGETFDPESGECHLAHAGFHILAILTWLEDLDRYGGFDDRYRREPA